jgi:hypothetical protein
MPIVGVENRSGAAIEPLCLKAPVPPRLCERLAGSSATAGARLPSPQHRCRASLGRWPGGVLGGASPAVSHGLPLGTLRQTALCESQPGLTTCRVRRGDARDGLLPIPSGAPEAPRRAIAIVGERRSLPERWYCARVLARHGGFLGNAHFRIRHVRGCRKACMWGETQAGEALISGPGTFRDDVRAPSRLRRLFMYIPPGARGRYSRMALSCLQKACAVTANPTANSQHATPDAISVKTPLGRLNAWTRQSQD